MKSVSIAFALGGLLVAGTAHADQCQWISEAEAAKAASLLAKKPKVIAFCEPCGDEVPGVPFAAQRVAVERADGDFKTVVIDGKAVDLAYTYVQTSDRWYQNVAALVGCPVEGVSLLLEVQDETPNGVLITAGNGAPPPPAAAPPAQPVAEPPVPVPPLVIAAPPAPQTIVYSTTYTQSISWLAVAIAGIGGLFAGGMTMLGAIAVRRRRAMRPRASDLPLR